MFLSLLPSLLLSLLPWLLPAVSAEVMATVEDYVRLADANGPVLDQLQKYIDEQTDRWTRLTYTLNYLKGENSEARKDPEAKFNNLLTTFKTMERFTIHWQEYMKHFFERPDMESEHARKTEEAAVKAGYPDAHDLLRLARSIFRVQDTFKFSAGDIISGAASMEDRSMNAMDCYYLGVAAYHLQDFYHATIWLEYALEMVNGGDNSLQPEVIFSHLNHAYLMTGFPENLARAMEICNEWLKLDQFNEAALAALNQNSNAMEEAVKGRQAECNDDLKCEGKVMTELYNSKPIFKRQMTEMEAGEQNQRFESACRGEKQFKSNRLRCQYRYDSPYLVLTPAKEEQLHFNPPVFRYHDLITDNEAATIKKIALPLLYRSTTLDAKRDSLERVSQQAWVDDKEPLSLRFSQRAVALARLAFGTLSDTQVVQYSVGGHYDTHTDYSKEGFYPEELGERMATFLCYINDVKVGGHTVFPRLGVRAPPVKNSCVLWYNLLLNGTGDIRTEHGSCPTVSGNKWIVNKWIHEKDQLFARPCGLKEDE